MEWGKRRKWRRMEKGKIDRGRNTYGDREGMREKATVKESQTE